MPAATGPAPEATRHLAMDTARGLALLGIFMVNIHFFSSSFLDFFAARPAPGSSTGEHIAFYFTLLFCQSKSYPLFSLLFGMGLALQRGRSEAAGRCFVPLYLRRLAALAAFGILHIVVLWYGDILLFYAIAGLGLLALSRLSARWLAGIGLGIIAFGTLAGTALGLLMAVASSHPQPSQPPAPAPIVAQAEGDATRTPLQRLLDPSTFRGVFASPGGPSGEAAQSLDNPAARRWRQAETEAFRDGPFLQALGVRALFWLMMFGFSITSFLWHVLAMFCLGAALVKAGIFSPAMAAWPRRLTLACLLPGIALAVATTVITRAFGPLAAALLGATELFIIPTLFALGYFGAVAWLCASGRLARITGVLAAAGRMALTNYLLQSLIASFIMYHWGLRQFGSFDRVERVALVTGIYACQLVFSVLWLRHFRFGPMEWLWRSLTYLKPQPMLRGGGSPEA